MSIVKRIAFLAVVTMLPLVVLAQSSLPVTILVSSSPGSSRDNLARLMAQRLPEHLGRPVVIENKTGALGTIAIKEVITAPAGRSVYTLAPFTNLIFPPLTQQSSPYDPFKELQPVANLAAIHLAVIVNTSIGASTPRELAAWLKQNPDKAQMGLQSIGGQSNFLAMQLSKAVGVDFTYVGYRQASFFFTDLMSGRIPMAIMPLGEIGTGTKDPRIRALGVLTPKRSPLAPDVPTFIEQGIPVVSGDSWFGMWTSATTPKVDVLKMEEAIRKVLAMPDVQEAVTKHGMVADFLTAEQTDRRLRAEQNVWAPTIKASGYRAD